MAVAAIFLFGLLTASSSAVPWRRGNVSFSVVNQPADQVLKTFASEQGLVLVATDRVTAPISGEFGGLAPQRFLDAVCDACDLVWFWDGARLHVSSATEVTTKPLAGEWVTAEQASAAFAALGFEQGPAQRGDIVRGSGRVFSLVGIPALLSLGEPVVRALDEQERSRRSQAALDAETAAEAERLRGEQMEVRVFRLKYASASDISVSGGSSQSTVPGVARALQNIMGQSSGSLSTGALRLEGPRQLEGLRGTGLAAIGRAENAPTDSASAPTAAQARRLDARRSYAEELVQPMIQADPRLNAIIVRDFASRMPLYEKLVAELDVSSPVIEISAAIVDIDANNDKSLGVEFLTLGDGNGRTKTRFGFEADRAFNQGSGENSGTTPVFQDGVDLVRGEGVLSSVLVPVGGYELLTRIRALEEKGAAQLVSSPSVITLENIEAHLRQEQTVFVRVSGQESSDLFNVSAGVQLRVTPTLVREGDDLSFRLIVEVEDGSFSDLSVDGVPSTRESAISTQAMVPTDRTLLIGGYFVEQHANNARQVPVLGNLPVLGRLFKRTENNHSRAQRYFFITPRLVDVQKEARHNRPALAAPEKSALPADVMDRQKSTETAHAMAGRSLPVHLPDAAVGTP